MPHLTMLVNERDHMYRPAPIYHPQENIPPLSSRSPAAGSIKTRQQRPARPEQIAAVIAFLASDDATNANGAILTADNGWFAAWRLIAQTPLRGQGKAEEIASTSSPVLSSTAVQGKFWEMHDSLFEHQQALADAH